MIPKPAAPNAGQLRAARALLRLSRDQVAHGAGVNDKTVERLEVGAVPVLQESVEKVTAFFRVRGVVFTATGGIERKSQ